MLIKLTDKNYKIYASNGYNNPYCLTEREFELDLSKVGTIRKLLATYLCGHTMNIRVIVNTVICFYNVFDHRTASTLLVYKNPNPKVLVLINTILKYLYLPECYHDIDDEFMQLLINEFGEVRR